MLITLAIGSAMGSVSSTVTILCDEMPQAKRWIVTGFVCLAVTFYNILNLNRFDYLLKCFTEFLSRTHVRDTGN